MKNMYISSSKTRIEPTNVMSFSLISTIQFCLIRISEEAYDPSNVCMYIERGIHRARGCCVATYHLAKLLRHHRHRCCHADGLDVCGHHLDRADTVQVSSPRSGIAVFSTPNVVHFGAALLVAAILSAPWQELWNAGLLLGLAGLGGVTYIIVVLWLARHRLADYQPLLSDWLWHTVLPLVSYTALVVAAIVLPSHPAPALFVIAAATMLLLFIGIHNAWDVVTYTAFERSRPQNTGQD